MPLFLLLCDDRRLVFRQSPSNRPCLLRTQVQWRIFLAFVENSKLRTLLSVDVCEDAGDGLPEVVATGEVNLDLRRLRRPESIIRLEDWGFRMCTGGLHLGQFCCGTT